MKPLWIALTAAVGVVLIVLASIFLGPPTGKSSPVGIMNTRTHLTAVSENRSNIRKGLRSAEAALRRVEAVFSAHLERSQLSAVNSVAAGERVKVSQDVIAVLDLSRKLTEQSQGAFDPTFSPVFRIWSAAGKAEHLPEENDLQAAREVSGWRHFGMIDNEVVKHVEGARIDLGGIAKGYGIDKATDAMLAAGCTGGLVEVGGDIRCFGRKADGSEWLVAVRDPFDLSRLMGTLTLGDGAVCTSGNYERFSVINGQRYSHIIDPRTTRPAETAPSVTVLAPTATVADGWATALSVLGPAGFELLPEGVEALVVTGGPDDFKLHTTDGFAQRFTLTEAFRPAPAGDE
ncbi:MAG: FAD:protein FMN transferase [Planctomycetota bacterium]